MLDVVALRTAAMPEALAPSTEQRIISTLGRAFLWRAAAISLATSAAWFLIVFYLGDTLGDSLPQPWGGIVHVAGLVLGVVGALVLFPLLNRLQVRPKLLEEL